MRTCFRPAVLAAAAASLLAQNTTSDPVIKVSVDLVQIDAVVTDSQGRHVSDLKPEEFQVFEDGRLQKITHFSYVQGNTRRGVPLPASLPRNSVPRVETVPLPAATLLPDQVSRTIVLIADDLGLAGDEILQIRRVMNNFVDHQMQPGDLASVITSSGGMGVVEQFTNDKRRLHAAIDRIHFVQGRVGQTWYEPIRELAPGLGDANIKLRVLNTARADIFATGTQAAMMSAIDGIRDMPGRKAIALFSDGFNQSVDRTVELANRASVVLYTFDARGLASFNISAVDSVYASKTALNIGSQERRREAGFRASQKSLDQLAAGTGGIFFHDNNGLDQGLATALDDMASYYLLGYQPQRGDFDAVHGAAPFHKIQVKILRAGLRVRSRSGFVGTPDQPAAAQHISRGEELHRALVSPFRASEIPVQLSAFYSASNHKTTLRAMMAIDGRAVRFEDAPDGKKRLALDIVAALYDASNRVVESSSRSFKSDIPLDEAQNLIDSGLVYNIDIAVSKAGPYQLRAAVSDAASDHFGSANVFVDIPDFNARHLALSSVLLSDSDPARNAVLTRSGVIGAGSAVTRVFAAGAALDYAFQIFGAHPEKGSGKPRIEIEVHLFRGPERIFTGRPIAVPVANSDPIVHAAGQIKLPDFLPSGDYALELIAYDRTAGSRAQVTQWVDFKLAR